MMRPILKKHDNLLVRQWRKSSVEEENHWASEAEKHGSREVNNRVPTAADNTLKKRNEIMMEPKK